MHAMPMRAAHAPMLRCPCAHAHAGMHTSCLIVLLTSAPSLLLKGLFNSSRSLVLLLLVLLPVVAPAAGAAS